MGGNDQCVDGLMGGNDQCVDSRKGRGLRGYRADLKGRREIGGGLVELWRWRVVGDLGLVGGRDGGEGKGREGREGMGRGWDGDGRGRGGEGEGEEGE